MKVIDWKIQKYDDALSAQRELLEQRISNEIENTLVLTEHPAVFTIGRQGSIENILVGKEKLQEENIEVVKIERGGDITYHGKGQLVAYPVFKLPEGRRNVKKFIRMIEISVVETCRAFGAKAVTIENLTGVWISETLQSGSTRQSNLTGPSGSPGTSGSPGPSGSPGTSGSYDFHINKWKNEKKICSIGLAFKKWTSYHGVALNVNCNLKPFSYMHLCGLKGKKATSLEVVTGEKIKMNEAKKIFIKNFENNWEKFINE